MVSLLSTYVSRAFLKFYSFPAQDPDDPHASLYDVDNENTIITLTDWWHTPSIAVSNLFLSQYIRTLNACPGDRSLSLGRQ